jgi:uncharacterized protein
MSEHSVVIDTNVLVSAFILPNSIARKALNKAIDTCNILFSPSTAEEFSEVLLRRKFDKYAALKSRLESINALISVSTIIQPTVVITASRDKKDNQFLELAVAAKASYIISGDNDLLVLHPFQGIPIITPSTFLEYQFT